MTKKLKVRERRADHTGAAPYVLAAWWIHKSMFERFGSIKKSKKGTTEKKIQMSSCETTYCDFTSISGGQKQKMLVVFCEAEARLAVDAEKNQPTARARYGALVQIGETCALENNVIAEQLTRNTLWPNFRTFAILMLSQSGVRDFQVPQSPATVTSTIMQDANTFRQSLELAKPPSAT